MLSKISIETLSDLIANRLSMMTISDQNDLREKLVLERALTELRCAQDVGGFVETPPAYLDIPRRGRRRKVREMMGEA
ncbi:MAG: hypothetical protein ABTQ34_02845 [Bdellovibrionales bacterium]